METSKYAITHTHIETSSRLAIKPDKKKVAHTPMHMQDDSDSRRRIATKNEGALKIAAAAPASLGFGAQAIEAPRTNESDAAVSLCEEGALKKPSCSP